MTEVVSVDMEPIAVSSEDQVGIHLAGAAVPMHSFITRHRGEDEWVTTVGCPSGERLDLRTTLHNAKLAELREGVWMWPTNLPSSVTGHPDIWNSPSPGRR